ncbi:MAG: hypothetical protein JXR77_13900 [Lentisphaeria bacterium]|nr:hypothetical protein [Lentisphaeria bacterium]
MRRGLFLSLLLVAWTSWAWIDYDDRVERREPAYGKAFQGFCLRLSTEAVDFEQDSGQKVRIDIRNETDSTTLAAPGGPERCHVLQLILADKEGGTMVSQNLLESAPANPIRTGRIPPRAGSELLTVCFDELSFAAFREYENGMPHVEAKARRVPAGELVPRLYVLKAVLFSAAPGKRPDFAIASEGWPILLRAKPGARMAEEERQMKMRAWLAKMSQGAYGGIGVSSQLAALGGVAVAPLIEMAEKRDPARESVRESRIWAIVTLCNTGSAKAEEYILGRLRDPVEFGDLAFLTWHSQGFRSPRVTSFLRTLAEDAACGRPLPWEAKHGPESRRHGLGALEFVFKHFISIRESVTDATVAGLVALGDPKLVGFGVLAWQPASEEAALRILAPIFAAGPVHGNVKRPVLACLGTAAKDSGFPGYHRDADANAQWLEACLWLHRRRVLSVADLRTALRWLVLDLPRESEEVQATLVGALVRLGFEGYPVTSERPHLPDDWVATWRWALQTSGIEAEGAIAYCTRMMRTRDALPDVVRLGLLRELKRLIGTRFPVPEDPAPDVDAAWTECGTWLVDNGYFGKKSQ